LSIVGRGLRAMPLKEFHKLIRLHLTIPVTTASVERAFSALNRLKNAFRSSMTQQRLNHFLLTHIYDEKLDQIDPNEIMSISQVERYGTYTVTVFNHPGNLSTYL
jgi:hypothetical protein